MMSMNTMSCDNSAMCGPQMLDMSMPNCCGDAMMVNESGMNMVMSSPGASPVMMMMPSSMQQQMMQQQMMMMMMNPSMSMGQSSMMCQMMEMCKSNPMMCQMMQNMVKSRRCMPACEIRDCGDCYMVECEVAGCCNKDCKIECSLQDRCLRICCEKMPMMCKDGECCMRMERQYGCYMRTIRLPENCRCEEITACCENGMLCIKCPKSSDKNMKGSSTSNKCLNIPCM